MTGFSVLRRSPVLELQTGLSSTIDFAEVTDHLGKIGDRQVHPRTPRANVWSSEISLRERSVISLSATSVITADMRMYTETA